MVKSHDGVMQDYDLDCHNAEIDSMKVQLGAVTAMRKSAVVALPRERVSVPSAKHPPYSFHLSVDRFHVQTYATTSSSTAFYSNGENYSMLDHRSICSLRLINRMTASPNYRQDRRPYRGGEDFPRIDHFPKIGVV